MQIIGDGAIMELVCVPYPNNLLQAPTNISIVICHRPGKYQLELTRHPTNIPVPHAEQGNLFRHWTREWLSFQRYSNEMHRLYLLLHPLSPLNCESRDAILIVPWIPICTRLKYDSYVFVYWAIDGCLHEEVLLVWSDSGSGRRRESKIKCSPGVNIYFKLIRILFYFNLAT